MPTRRTVLQIGALATLGVAGAELGLASAQDTSGGLLAARNTPVPFAGVFVRPPELNPFETGFDEGDPARPFARFAVTAQLGRANILPGLTTTIAGYNGTFPGPTIRTAQGTRAEVRIRNGFPTSGLIFPRPSTSARTCTALSRCRNTTATPTTSPGPPSSRTTTTRTPSAPPRSGTTTTGTSSQPRTSTPDWRASTPSRIRSSGPSCPRTSTTCP